MSRADRRVAEWLFLLTFIAYAWFHAGGGWNQNSQLDLTRAIVERRTFAIDAYAQNSGDLSFAGGHVYSNKSPALSWIAALPYAAMTSLERARGLEPNDVDLVTLNAYVCTLFSVALPGALIPALLYAAGRRREVAPAWCAIVALTIALATPLFPYATIFMLHVPSAMLLLVALTSPRSALGGFAAGLATAMNYLCAPALAFVFLARRRVAFVLGALPPLLALAAYQQLCFGNMLTNSLAKEDPRFHTQHAIFGIFDAPSLEAAWGITLSPYRGFLFFAPVLLLAFAGAWFWFRRRDGVRELAAIAFVTLVFFAFNVTFNGWEGGFAVGARYLVPLIPLFGVALLELRGRLAMLLVPLALLSFAINFVAAAVDPQPSGTIPRPVTQYLVPLFVHGRFSPDVPITPPWSAATFTGHTSVNRLTYDEAIVFSRHPPGSREAEWTSFNLAEPFFGAGDVRSVLPLLGVIACGCAMVLTLSRRAQESPQG